MLFLNSDMTRILFFRMPQCKLTSRRNLGGRLVCFCRSQSRTYTNPKEVICSNFTGPMLESWIRKYKTKGSKISGTEEKFDLDSMDLSTPSGLASYYEYLIEIFGFRTAAYTMKQVKLDR